MCGVQIYVKCLVPFNQLYRILINKLDISFKLDIFSLNLNIFFLNLDIFFLTISWISKQILNISSKKYVSKICLLNKKSNHSFENLKNSFPILIMFQNLYLITKQFVANTCKTMHYLFYLYYLLLLYQGVLYRILFRRMENFFGLPPPPLKFV